MNILLRYASDVAGGRERYGIHLLYRILCLGPIPCLSMNLSKGVSCHSCGSLLKMTSAKP